MERKLCGVVRAPQGFDVWRRLVSITGRQELLIENYRGILEYTQNHISLQAKTCRVMIRGKNLHISYYTNEEMKITGLIDSVLYES